MLYHILAGFEHYENIETEMPGRQLKHGLVLNFSSISPQSKCAFTGANPLSAFSKGYSTLSGDYTPGCPETIWIALATCCRRHATKASETLRSLGLRGPGQSAPRSSAHSMTDDIGSAKSHSTNLRVSCSPTFVVYTSDMTIWFSLSSPRALRSLPVQDSGEPGG